MDARNAHKPMTQGLKANQGQFMILVLVNAFVGAMVGIERTVLPDLATERFHVDAHTAILSFIAAFGITKAMSNYAVARLSVRYERRAILIMGWLFAVPVPFLLMYAQAWWWVIAANILLGVNQGLAWSATVIMKVDLVGSKDRGLAMGINEFAGYLSVGVASYWATHIASLHGPAFYPFIPGIGFMVMGLLSSVFLVRDTGAFVRQETLHSHIPLMQHVWKDVVWRHRNVGSVTLNGVVNNMNDGVVWGLLPLFLLQRGLSLQQVGIIAGIYPVVWGSSQLFTGRLGDAVCKKQVITIGMLMQAVAILLLTLLSAFPLLVLAAVLLGLGTAMVYPNFLTVVAENTHPSQRVSALSIFRACRDGGYVAGALMAGVLADLFGMQTALLTMAVLTAGAGLVAHYRMCCTTKQWWRDTACGPVPAF